MMRKICLFLICIAFSGCVKKPLAWRLTPGSPTLVPPAGVRNTAVAGTGLCPSTPGIVLVKRGKALRISVTPEALAGRPAGWLRQWSTDLEAQGCIPQGAALDFAALITQATPLEPARAFALLHEPNRDAIDLEPGRRLQVTAPLLRAGANPDAPLLGDSTVTAGQGNQLEVQTKTSADLLGYEVIWYVFEPRQKGPGHRLVPVSSERHFTDRLEKSEVPTQNYLAMPNEAAFYKMVYKAQVSAQSVAELLVAGSSPVELEKAAAEVIRTGDCPPHLGKMCLPVPRRVAVNSVLFVQVNGAATELTRDFTVSGALHAAGLKDAGSALPSLKVLKEFHGAMIPVEFDRHASAILSMQLLGGEQIVWN